MKGFRVLGTALLATALVGCNKTGAMDPEPGIDAASAGNTATFKPNADAGISVEPSTDLTKLTNYVASRDKAGAFGTPRSDPFALTSSEKTFDQNQDTERFFGTAGGFSVQVKPKPEEEIVPTPPEPQPYRRLSGIIVGDSILALLEEEGRASVLIMPGSQIPNSPWRVLSIDAEKAVLVRSGKTLPTQIVVRLETRPFGQTPDGGAGGLGESNPSGRPGTSGSVPPGGFDPNG